MDDSTKAHLQSRQSPAYALYGEGRISPDALHCETIVTRAAQHGWRIARHRHLDLHQFFLVTQGGGEIRTASEVIALDLPLIISVPPQVTHGFLFHAGTEGYVVSVPKVLLAPAQSLGLTELRMCPATDQARALIEQIAARHAAVGAARDVALTALAVALASDCASDDVTVRAGDRGQALYARFTALLRDHATQGWSVADYAAALATSATQLNRVVRAQAETSVMGAVQAHLVGEAAKRLAYTRSSVSEIAYALGFADAAYFARVFRKHMGLSPRAFRQQFG